MNKTFEKLRKENIHYYLYAPKEISKKVLIVSGLHGNEGGVIEPLFDFFYQYKNPTISIVFIPTMCPSALQKRERNNARGHNANRIFDKDICDPEKDIVTNIVMEHAPFDLVVSFHEDLEYPNMYVYEMGKCGSKIQLKKWQREIKKMGIQVLNGMDDPNDTDLRNTFVEGYHHKPHPVQNGQFEDWVVAQCYAKRSLTVEIPSSASKDQKRELIRLSCEQLGEM